MVYASSVDLHMEVFAVAHVPQQLGVWNTGTWHVAPTVLESFELAFEVAKHDDPGTSHFPTLDPSQSVNGL